MDIRNNKPEVLLVNTIDKGGAANSCKRLHLSLLQSNVRSNVLLRYKTQDWPKSQQFHQLTPEVKKHQKFLNKVQKGLNKYSSPIKELENERLEFLSKRDKSLELFSFPQSSIDITSSNVFKSADIINLHWVANFIDYKSFFRKNTKPVVWTLHDMNPFSGGEHYQERYCGIDEDGFPILRTPSIEEYRISSLNLEIKKKALREVKNLTIVSPSKWLAREAEKSELFHGYDIQVIPYGLDSRVFKSRDQRWSRDILGIPDNKKIFLFVADSINNQRKGFQYLKRAFQELERDDILLCAIGNQKSGQGSIANVLELGPINDDRLMSIAYSAADAFVIPSLMDNFPNTILESLMCGTPVIGFPIGGIPDMVENGVNGYLTKEINVPSLVEALKEFLQRNSPFDKATIRNNAVLKYDSKIQAKRYSELFYSILPEK